MSTDQTVEKLSYRARTAASMLDIPYRTLLNLIHDGEIGSRRAGRYYLVPRAEIERYIEQAISKGRAS